MMFLFVNFWTVAIHDGNTIGRRYFFLEKELHILFLGNVMLYSTIINSTAHHTLHHRNFNCNFGQYFTLFDRIGGSYCQPNESSMTKHKAI